MADEITTTAVADDSKVWYLSKRIWLNVISLAGIGITKFTGYTLTADDIEVILSGIAIINLVLTIISTKKVTITKQK